MNSNGSQKVLNHNLGWRTIPFSLPVSFASSPVAAGSPSKLFIPKTNVNTEHNKKPGV